MKNPPVLWALIIIGLMGVGGNVAAADRVTLTGHQGTAVQQIRLSPIKGTGAALASLIEEGDRIRVVVSLTNVPSDLANPRVIAEIHEGTCSNLKSAPVYAVEKAPAGYSAAAYSAPSPDRSFGGIVPASLATLRSGAHAITVKTGPESGNVAFACGNIA